MRSTSRSASAAYAPAMTSSIMTPQPPGRRSSARPGQTLSTSETRKSRKPMTTVAAEIGTPASVSAMPQISSSTAADGSCPYRRSSRPHAHTPAKKRPPTTSTYASGDRSGYAQKRTPAASALATVAGAAGKKPLMQPEPSTTARRSRNPTRTLPIPRGCRRPAGSRQLLQHLLAHALQGVEDADPLAGDRLEARLARRVQLFLQVVEPHHIAQVALVVLECERDVVEREPVLGQVLVQVVHALDVGVEALRQRIDDEDDPVHPAQDELAAGVVVHLAGHRVQVEADAEPLDAAEIEWQEVEEERPVHVGGERDQPALRLRAQAVVDVADVGRLPPQPGAVVDDVAAELVGGVVDQRHVRRCSHVAAPGGSQRGPKTGNAGRWP